MQTTRTATLLFKHLRNELTSTEEQELRAFLAASDENRLLFEQLTTPESLAAELNALYSHDIQSGWDKLTALRASEGLYWSASRFNWRQLTAVAAAAILVLSTIIWLYIKPSATITKQFIAQILPTDLLSTNDQPVLTLQNNTTISLGPSVKTITDGNTTIQWDGRDKLTYTLNTGGVSQTSALAASFNIISTPAHQPLQMHLADGSDVQLDPSTVIHYPANAAGTERVVNMITGIAIFRVAPDSFKPFRVQISDIAISAKGTRFSVSALPYEQKVKAELEDGIIEIRNRHYKIVLQPGQQALLDNDGPITVTNKSGPPSPDSYRFFKDDFAATARKLEAWFGVKVQYTKAPEGVYSGHFNKTVPLNQILAAIGKNFHVTMHLEGDMVTVSNVR